MKQLFLLRHTQTLPSEGGGDSERKITPNGMLDSKALGQFMARKEYRPDFALCSTAARTKQTLKNVMEALGEAKTEYLDILYNGSAGDYFKQLQQIDDAHNSVLLVAHNPSIYELAVRLSGAGPESLMARLTQGYKPGSISVIDCPCETWAELALNECELTDFAAPLDYNAPATPARWT